MCEKGNDTEAWVVQLARVLRGVGRITSNRCGGKVIGYITAGSWSLQKQRVISTCDIFEVSRGINSWFALSLHELRLVKAKAGEVGC